MSFGIYNAFIFDRNYTMQELIKNDGFFEERSKRTD